jgi:hypothetical protein
MTASHFFSQLPTWKFAARRLYQRICTHRPTRVRPFEKLFPAPIVAAGIPGKFTGILHRETGRPFAVQPTQYHKKRGANWGDEDRGYLTHEPDRILYSLAGGGLCTSMGFVYDPPSRTFIGETLDHWDIPQRRHPMLAAPKFPEPQGTLAGTAFLLSGFGGTNFYHFLVDILPKLHFARSFLEEDVTVLIPNDSQQGRRLRRWVERAGWKRKVSLLPAMAHFRCEQLLFCNRVTRHLEPNPWSIDAVRSALGLPTLAEDEAVPGAGEVLWLDRSRHPSRRVSWETDLALVLRRRLPQLRIVDAGNFTPDAIIALCRSAKALAGMHGAAFANQIFCRPGTRIVELFARVNFPFYSRLANACGHRHTALLVPEKPGAGELDRLAGEMTELILG